MIYAALVMWLVIIVFCAQGVYHLWTRFAKPKLVNILLLPGTLVAQLGYVLGCLVTGSPVGNATLMGGDGGSQGGPPKAKVPLIGSMIVALGPLITCGVTIYLLTVFLADEMVRPIGSARQQIPLSVGQCWRLLHDAINLAESFAGAFEPRKLIRWQHLLALYLTICLTVRMAPLPGNLRGGVLGVAGLGLILAIVNVFVDSIRPAVIHVWPVVSLAAAALLFLLAISLAVRAAASLVMILVGKM